MSLTGSDYLLRLSGLAVSFVGFASVIVALGRAFGSELSDLHMHFVRLFIEGGLLVAVLGLLPPALVFTGLSEPTIWRLSSAVAALMWSGYVIHLFHRRRRLIPGRVPLPAIVDYMLFIVAVLALWMNAAGFRSQPGVAPYVLALTWFLVLGGAVFLQNLDLFFRLPPKS